MLNNEYIEFVKKMVRAISLSQKGIDHGITMEYWIRRSCHVSRSSSMYLNVDITIPSALGHQVFSSICQFSMCDLREYGMT